MGLCFVFVIVYPAIDIKEGKCVRLLKGLESEVTVFNDSPLLQAKKFESVGLTNLHIVDLDGAFSAQPKNLLIVREIVEKTKLKVQLGGGIRSFEQIKYWLDSGIETVILGTKAFEDLNFLEVVCRMYPYRISVSLDAKEGILATHGWVKSSGIHVLDFIKSISKLEICSLVYTDIATDGTLAGPNFKMLEVVCAASPFQIIASGGVGCVEHLESIKKINNIKGAIVGRAFYDGKISLDQLLQFNYAA